MLRIISLHPSWRVIVDNDESCLRRLTDTDIVTDVSALRNWWFDNRTAAIPAFRSDLCRLLQLHTHGGVYMDSDIELLTPLGTMLAGRSEFVAAGVSNKPELVNSILAAPARSPLVQRCVTDFDRVVRGSLKLGNNFYGPWLLGQAVRSMIGPHANVAQRQSLSAKGVALFEERQLSHSHNLTRGRQPGACNAAFVNVTTNEVVAFSRVRRHRHVDKPCHGRFWARHCSLPGFGARERARLSADERARCSPRHVEATSMLRSCHDLSNVGGTQGIMFDPPKPSSCPLALSLAGGGAGGIGMQQTSMGDTFSGLIFGLHAALRSRATQVLLDDFFWQGVGSWPWALLPFDRTSAHLRTSALARRGFDSPRGLTNGTLLKPLPQGIGYSHARFLRETGRCNAWYRVHTAQRSCAFGFYCHTHLPGAWHFAISSDVFMAAASRSAMLSCVNQKAAQMGQRGGPALVAWHLNSAEGVRWESRFSHHLRLLRRINATILSAGLGKRGVRHVLIPATEKCREELERADLPGMEIAAARDEMEQLLLMVSASVLVTFASVPGLAAAALAPSGVQLHLFLPPKETLSKNRNPLRLRDDGAFQTHFFAKNTVPLDCDGTPFEEYSGKLSAMLMAIDRAEVAPAVVAEASFEQWLDATHQEELKVAGNDPACRASCGACSAKLLGKPRALTLDAEVPTFFLHETGGLNFSAVVAELEDLMGGLPPDTAFPILGEAAYRQLQEEAWKPSVRASGLNRTARLRHEAAKLCGWGQYFVDVPLLGALARHPRRVHLAEQAELHILGALPFASHLLATAVDGDTKRHAARMRAAAKALRELPHYGCEPPTGKCSSEKPMVLLVPGEDLGVVGTEFQRALLMRHGAVLAVSDGMNSWLGANRRNPARGLMEAGIVIPYLSHLYAYQEGDVDRLGERRGLMFHGGSQRWDYGLRKRMLASMNATTHEQVPLLLRTSADARERVASGVMVGVAGAMDGNTTAAAVLEAYMQSGAAYHRASMCMCPSGDVVSSRRMFDAMSAGCVPVLVRSQYVLNQESLFSSVPRDRSFFSSLPFPRSIDWRNITLRWAPDMAFKSRSPCLHGDAEWLQEKHHQLLTSASLEALLRGRIRAAFRQHLDYQHNPRGVATAMLREAAARAARTAHGSTALATHGRWRARAAQAAGASEAGGDGARR